jgi:hypothetical protein
MGMGAVHFEPTAGYDRVCKYWLLVAASLVGCFGSQEGDRDP